MAAEVAAVVEKFDSEMEAMETELRALEETFRKEREQCDQFNEHFLKVRSYSPYHQQPRQTRTYAFIYFNRLTRSSLESTQRSACWKRSEHVSGRSKWFVTGFENVSGIVSLTSPFLQMIYNAATRIQKVYRGLLCRREYAKMVAKNKRGGGKKGKKGKKK